VESLSSQPIEGILVDFESESFVRRREVHREGSRTSRDQWPADDRRRPDRPPRLSQDGAPIHQFARLSAYAEQMLVHEHSLVKVTPDVPVELQALVGCAVVTGVGAVMTVMPERDGALHPTVPRLASCLVVS
jgi:hypothetical protein